MKINKVKMGFALWCEKNFPCNVGKIKYTSERNYGHLKIYADMYETARIYVDTDEVSVFDLELFKPLAELYERYYEAEMWVDLVEIG